LTFGLIVLSMALTSLFAQSRTQEINADSGFEETCSCAGPL
jgi:hypothetical protein